MRHLGFLCRLKMQYQTPWLVDKQKTMNSNSARRNTLGKSVIILPSALGLRSLPMLAAGCIASVLWVGAQGPTERVCGGAATPSWQGVRVHG